MLIKEVIVSTLNPDGSTHLAPMGLQLDDDPSADGMVLAPFLPSRSFENLQRTPLVVVNCVADVRVFAGCLCGRRDWPMRPAKRLPEVRYLACALSHAELELLSIEHDEVRPRVSACISYQENHAPFTGFNRAQAAVIELAVLVSRLDRLPSEKYEREIDYLKIAIDKTAGEKELTAWRWLMQKVHQHRRRRHQEGKRNGGGGDR